MYSTYLRLGVMVADSDIDVIRAARRKFRAPRIPHLREQRKAFYRAMLDQHHKACALYRQVMRGDFA